MTANTMLSQRLSNAADFCCLKAPFNRAANKTNGNVIALKEPYEMNAHARHHTEAAHSVTPQGVRLDSSHYDEITR